jgi:hypothetical protein
MQITYELNTMENNMAFITSKYHPQTEFYEFNFTNLSEVYISSFSGSVNYDDELLFFEKVAKIAYVYSSMDNMEIIRCANMNFKEYFNFVRNGSTQFDSLEEEINQ